ncbi:SDR family oxidoreductase [Pendulispora brunnea]|uniref:SDR family oxidoreductase n=1 Tax=Pendulispora brunnea TaxID=2905690 RepID=A0ABZ2KBP9_9BACT
MKNVILITGASSGMGALTARELARAGHTVYASMRDIKGRNAAQADAAKTFAEQTNTDLRAIEMDIASQSSVDAAVRRIVSASGGVDVLVHNAGHMVFGPAEAFTPEQYAELFDTNVLGTQRVNRSVLPLMRARGKGLLVWVSSSSVRGGTPPYLAPYFAAKAAMDQLAVSYAGELVRWGIETSIVVPGAFTIGTNHFRNAGQPADAARAAEYHHGPYAGFGDDLLKGLASTEPPDSDVGDVARAIADVVSRPHGKRPFRVHIDPASDGSQVVSDVGDRIRAEFLRRIGQGDILKVKAS